jgi:hypothetical protein
VHGFGRRHSALRYDDGSSTPAAHAEDDWLVSPVDSGDDCYLPFAIIVEGRCAPSPGSDCISVVATDDRGVAEQMPSALITDGCRVLPRRGGDIGRVLHVAAANDSSVAVADRTCCVPSTLGLRNYNHRAPLATTCLNKIMYL